MRASTSSWCTRDLGGHEIVHGWRTTAVQTEDPPQRRVPVRQEAGTTESAFLITKCIQYGHGRQLRDGIAHVALSSRPPP